MPRQQRPLRVGVTGHRHLGDNPVVHWYVHTQCVRILDRLIDMAGYRDQPIEAYSALAIGADQIFAQAALGLGIPLIAAIPFEDYANDFEGDDLPRFEFLLRQCRHVHRLPHKKKSGKAYLDVGKWLVNQVEYVVAVWTGQPPAGPGSTANIVDYAIKRKRVLMRIDPADTPFP